MTGDFNLVIKKTIEILTAGGTILYPTDTVWGIGCDATNTSTVEKIYRIKKRNESKSMIILLADKAHLYNYVQAIPEEAFQLIQQAKKPLTIIYDKAKNLPPNLIAEDGSIAIRIVQDDFCKMLIKQFGKPLVSTSANISGQPHPALYKEISEEIKTQVDFIIPLKQDIQSISTPSSIIRCRADGTTEVIRK